MTSIDSGTKPLLAAVGLFVTLVIAGVVLGRPGDEPIPFDLDSPNRRGLLAFKLWLTEMGYPAQRLARPVTEARPPTGYVGLDESELVVVFRTAVSYSPAEARALRRWVAAGHTLVLVDKAGSDPRLRELFGVDGRPAPRSLLISPPTNLLQVQPLFPDADLVLRRRTVGRILALDGAPDAVEAIASDFAGPTAAVQAVGDGVVWHLTDAHGLLNEDLSDRNGADHVPALLRLVTEGAQVALDVPPSPDATVAGGDTLDLQGWLFHHPTGQAVILLASAVYGFWLLSGSRLGPPIAEADLRPRRQAAEHVVAMAALYRRAGKRHDIALHYKRRLKATLAARAGIDPALSDEVLVSRLVEAGTLTRAGEAQLVAALARLDSVRDDNDLIRAASDADRLYPRSS